MSDSKLTDDDKALFRSMMSNVKPLGDFKKLPLNERAPATCPTSKTHLKDIPTTTYDLSNYYAEPVSSDAILEYCKQSIPRKRLTQLKSGQIPWEALLDLHGFRPDAARDRLCQFIEQQTQLGGRCLLIIHGKGGQHFDAPVLKNHVNHWLQQLPQVLAFHSALPKDGGSGALYVLLQRLR